LNIHECRKVPEFWKSVQPVLGFGQLAFPYEAFVWFVGALDPILVLAGTFAFRQSFGDFIKTAGSPTEDRGREFYNLADVKFVAGHVASTPTQLSV